MYSADIRRLGSVNAGRFFGAPPAACQLPGVGNPMRSQRPSWCRTRTPSRRWPRRRRACHRRGGCPGGGRLEQREHRPDNDRGGRSDAADREAGKEQCDCGGNDRRGQSEAGDVTQLAGQRSGIGRLQQVVVEQQDGQRHQCGRSRGNWEPAELRAGGTQSRRNSEPAEVVARREAPLQQLLQRHGFPVAGPAPHGQWWR
jgi:hypothetical protein